MKRQLLFCGIMLLVISHADAQQHWKFGVSTIKASLFYPSIKNFSGPYHPGFSFLGERLVKTRKNSNKIISFEGGFYHHEYFQNGIFLLGGINYEYPIKSKLKLSWGPRLGYLHTFSPTGKYQHIDGEFKQIKDWGRPTGLVGLALGVEYPMINIKDSQNSVDLFFNYQVLVEGPFAPGAGVPVIPHIFSSLGIKVKLF
ncbi:hypothetical protein [Fulvivirga lutimaris]|uniref:hypothetical protein n=1 Tax=Fulvivirga lutimaris TaxID=1819566 RepID=UPI0012BC2B9C|nr:hypothetical protein [Fulvivirga lutimaris]MTI41674.1 hypothetical protein [Fulvivirga lutimaris]